jgi:hypothetical protein
MPSPWASSQRVLEAVGEGDYARLVAAQTGFVSGHLVAALFCLLSTLFQIGRAVLYAKVAYLFAIYLFGCKAHFPNSPCGRRRDANARPRGAFGIGSAIAMNLDGHAAGNRRARTRES